MAYFVKYFMAFSFSKVLSYPSHFLQPLETIPFIDMLMFYLWRKSITNNCIMIKVH